MLPRYYINKTTLELVKTHLLSIFSHSVKANYPTPKTELIKNDLKLLMKKAPSKHWKMFALLGLINAISASKSNTLQWSLLKKQTSTATFGKRMCYCLPLCEWYTTVHACGSSSDVTWMSKHCLKWYDWIRSQKCTFHCYP